MNIPAQSSVEEFLVTPGRDGMLDLPEGSESFLFPAGCYLEQKIEDCRVKFLGDIWADSDRAVKYAGKVADTADDLSQACIQAFVPHLGLAAKPLFQGPMVSFVSMAVTHALRMGELNWKPNASRVLPARLNHVLERVGRVENLKHLNKNQQYQWLLIRLLAGADDHISWSGPNFRQRVLARIKDNRRFLSVRRECANGLFGSNLHSYKEFFSNLNLPIHPIPDLVAGRAVRRRAEYRKILYDILYKSLSPLLKEIHSPLDAKSIVRLFSELFPESRLEGGKATAARYEDYFNRNEVSGMVTAVGQAWSDITAFFMTECTRRRLPSVVVQHGGQYGYDNRMPHFFALDVGLPSHFASWGWDEYPSGYDVSRQRAKIVPMPSPKLSAILDKPWTPLRGGQPRVLFVPLSKGRTIDQRFGGIVPDGLLEWLREQMWAVVQEVAPAFDEIIISYREKDINLDPFAKLLKAGIPDKITVVSARKRPATEIMQSASAVFWDVATTGVFETLVYGVPTVTLLQRGRWAKDAHWAESLLVENGVAGYDASTVAKSLLCFSQELETWNMARDNIQPVLDTYAKTSYDCEDQWRQFLSNLSLDVPISLANSV